MHINEDQALLLRSRHRELLIDLHKKYGGEVLQFFGDGTLSIFHSSVNAVECAVEMQIEYKKEPEVPVRIGIHVGDISYDGVDAFGDGLNVAARIEPICEPGGVFISERVFEDIRNHAWLQAIHVGNFQLKNIAGDTPLYAISSKGMALPVVRNPRFPPVSYTHLLIIVNERLKQGILAYFCQHDAQSYRYFFRQVSHDLQPHAAGGTGIPLAAQ